MSKTDKTRPWRVKALDLPAFLEEAHDHTGGGCDLPPRPTSPTSPWGDRTTTCRWVASREFWSHRANDCGCRLCTDQVQRKLARRRERRDIRLAIRTDYTLL